MRGVARHTGSHLKSSGKRFQRACSRRGVRGRRNETERKLWPIDQHTAAACLGRYRVLESVLEIVVQSYNERQNGCFHLSLFARNQRRPRGQHSLTKSASIEGFCRTCQLRIYDCQTEISRAIGGKFFIPAHWKASIGQGLQHKWRFLISDNSWQASISGLILRVEVANNLQHIDAHSELGDSVVSSCFCRRGMSPLPAHDPGYKIPRMHDLRPQSNSTSFRSVRGTELNGYTALHGNPSPSLIKYFDDQSFAGLMRPSTPFWKSCICPSFNDMSK